MQALVGILWITRQFTNKPTHSQSVCTLVNLRTVHFAIYRPVNSQTGQFVEMWHPESDWKFVLDKHCNSAVTVTEPNTAVFVRTVVNRNRGFLEPSEDGFAIWRLYLYSVKLQEQMHGQTYKYARQQRPPWSPPSRRVDVAATCGLCQEKRMDERESNLMHFSLKMWHLVAKMLTNFVMINLTKLHVFIGRSRILSPPLNLCEVTQFVPPIGWTPLTDTMDKETNERTDGRTNEQRDASLCPPVS